MELDSGNDWDRDGVACERVATSKSLSANGSAGRPLTGACDRQQARLGSLFFISLVQTEFQPVALALARYGLLQTMMIIVNWAFL